MTGYMNPVPVITCYLSANTAKDNKTSRGKEVFRRRMALRGFHPGATEMAMIVWCLVGKGGMDPYGSPYIIPTSSPHNPFPHSLLRTRQ